MAADQALMFHNLMSFYDFRDKILMARTLHAAPSVPEPGMVHRIVWTEADRVIAWRMTTEQTLEP